MTPVRDHSKFIDGSQELADELDLQTRRSLEAGLQELDVFKGAHRGMARELEKLEAPYRHWLEEHDGERIEDSEHGLVAELRPYTIHSHTYDPVKATMDRLPDLYRRLMELECLAPLEWDAGRIEDAIKRGLLSAGDVAAIKKPDGQGFRFHVGAKE